jgi:uncharacterized membrane protein (UPF0127 family)
MRFGRWIALILGLGLGAVGCQKAGTADQAPSRPTAVSQSSDPSAQPQPKLETVKVWLGTEELTAEVARTPDQLQKGMMFRESMEENEAMLFVFPRPHRTGFWMKNTDLPLSAAYIDPTGEILEIHDLQPQNTNTVRAASDRIQFVLETRQGWFERHQVSTGAVLRTEQGSLMETFFGSN